MAGRISCFRFWYWSLRSANGTPISGAYLAYRNVRLEHHGASAILHRAGGCFKHAHHTQTGITIRQRSRPVLDGIGKVLRFDAQSFGDVELRAEHIARAVGDQLFVNRLGATVAHRDAFVVKLDLFARLQIVVDDHLSAAADQRLANFDRREPVDVEVGDQRAVVKGGYVGDVFGGALHMTNAGGRNRDRELGQNVLHDREVMHGQIPDYVYVVLEESEIDADRIVVVDL